MNNKSNEYRGNSERYSQNNRYRDYNNNYDNRHNEDRYYDQQYSDNRNAALNNIQNANNNYRNSSFQDTPPVSNRRFENQYYQNNQYDQYTHNQNPQHSSAYSAAQNRSFNGSPVHNGYKSGSLGERLDNGDYDNTISMPDIHDKGYDTYIINNSKTDNYSNYVQPDNTNPTSNNYTLKNPAYYDDKNYDTAGNVNPRSANPNYQTPPLQSSSLNNSRSNPSPSYDNYYSYKDNNDRYNDKYYNNQSNQQKNNRYDDRYPIQQNDRYPNQQKINNVKNYDNHDISKESGYHSNNNYKDKNINIEHVDNYYYDDNYNDEYYNDDYYYDDNYDDHYDDYDNYYDDEYVKSKKSNNSTNKKINKNSGYNQNNSKKKDAAKSSAKKQRLTKKDGFFDCFKKKDAPHIIGVILCGIQALLSLVLFVVLIILDMLPIGLFIVVVLIIAIFWGLVFISQHPRFGKLHIPGKILSCILIILLCIGNYYISLGNKAVENVTDETAYEIENYVVAVLAGDSAQTLSDAKDYTFGVQSTFQPMNLDKVLTEINDELGKEITTKNYNSVLEEINALFSKEVQAVIYNDTFNSTIREQYENLDNEIRVIKTVKIKKQVNISSTSNVDVTTEPFLFYISGNDDYGELSMIGRSDVNILVAVNPVTREILLINTPRDYYVVFPDISYGERDKLTHAGIYGMDVQEATLAELYGYQIDYYCRVNFSSLISIVDCLGGIDINNDVEFTAINGGYFPAGYMHLDGDGALMYCRERKAFEDGDFERGRHQQMVIKAIVDKLLSSTGFTSYSKLIKTLESCCATNMPKEAISALVKKQLSEGGTWNIQMAQAEGEPMMQMCFSVGEMPLSVIMPYAKSITNVSTMLSQIYNGEAVTVLQLGEYDDYSYVTEPGPITQSETEPVSVDDSSDDTEYDTTEDPGEETTSEDTTAEGPQETE